MSKRLTPAESVTVLREALRLARNYLTAKTANGQPQRCVEDPTYVLRQIERAYTLTGGVTKRAHQDDTPPLFPHDPPSDPTSKKQEA